MGHRPRLLPPRRRHHLLDPGLLRREHQGRGQGLERRARTLMFALEKGMYLAAFLFVGAAYSCVWALELPLVIFACVSVGLPAGIVIGKFTEYFTSFDFGPIGWF